MHDSPAHRTRRTALGLGAGIAAATAVSVATGGTAHATALPMGHHVSRRLRELERLHSARIGVFAGNVRTGSTVAYRAAERFPLCSLFKTLAAAAVLRDLDHDGAFLAKRVHYTARYAKDSGYDAITGKPENVARGMTVEELCSAAVSHSDNAAANLLLEELGGPTAITRFCRSTGDRTTRLDRWEPHLNSAEPHRRTDTTTPLAIARTYSRLTLGDALDPGDRRRLTRWMLATSTSTHRFRAGLPDGWTVADKTGTGSYGTANDAGTAWTPDGTPVVLSVLTTKRDREAPADDALVAAVARLVSGALVENV
ncbi:class A beta-lactamase [Streptomyces sp. NPDC016309]|uniref:class A beta-lactamase n=1 Tax=Streptomyces sp. NPDC016309 TaxID=3364965 RepID=UPI00370352A7